MSAPLCALLKCTREPLVLASSDYAESIAAAARTLYKPRSLDLTLQTIIEVACNSVPVSTTRASPR